MNLINTKRTRCKQNEAILQSFDGATLQILTEWKYRTLIISYTFNGWEMGWWSIVIWERSVCARRSDGRSKSLIVAAMHCGTTAMARLDGIYTLRWGIAWVNWWPGDVSVYGGTTGGYPWISLNNRGRHFLSEYCMNHFEASLILRHKHIPPEIGFARRIWMSDVDGDFHSPLVSK